MHQRTPHTTTYTNIHLSICLLLQYKEYNMTTSHTYIPMNHAENYYVKLVDGDVWRVYELPEGVGGVYTIHNHLESLVYIGQTGCFKSRFSGHEQAWLRDVYFSINRIVDVGNYEHNKANRLRYEQALIQEHVRKGTPLFNRTDGATGIAFAQYKEFDVTTKRSLNDLIKNTNHDERLDLVNNTTEFCQWAELIDGSHRGDFSSPSTTCTTIDEIDVPY